MVNRATSLESKIVPLLTVTVTIARASTVTRRPAAPLAPHVAARVRSGGHGGGFTSAYRTPAYGEHATALPELGKHGKCAPVRCWRASGCKPVTRANVLRSEIIRSRETGVYAGYSARRPDAVFHSTMFDEVMDEFAAKVAGLTDGDVWHACLRQLRRAAPPRPLPGQGAREFAWEERVPTIIGAAPRAVFPILDGCGRQVGAQASPGPSPSFWLAPDDHHRIIEQLPV